MNRVKAIGLTIIFGLLSIAIVAGGFIISMVVSVMTPILMVFTGLWVVWFIATEQEDDKSD